MFSVDIIESGFGSVSLSNGAAICDTNWNDVSANVACQELGYLSGKAVCCGQVGFLLINDFLVNY